MVILSFLTLKIMVLEVIPKRAHQIPCLGSQYWSKHPHRAGYNPKYVLIDMVGARAALLKVIKRTMQVLS